MLGRIDVKVAGFTVYSKEIGFKSVDRAIKKITDNIEKIKSVADGSAFDPEKIAKNAKSRAISSFRAKLPKGSLKVYDDLVGLSKSVKKARNDTINDSRRRIPGKLATIVTQYYGIKKSEIMPNKGAKAAANISNAYEKGIVYTGRLLTPTHFKMKAKTSIVPFQRADGSTGRRKVQTISAEIIKGQRKILGSNLFLAKSGAAEGAPMIPFQRRGKARTPIDVFKTLSVPQMLTGDLARPELEACIVEVMNERYTHNLNRHMSRYVKGKVGL